MQNKKAFNDEVEKFQKVLIKRMEQKGFSQSFMSAFFIFFVNYIQTLIIFKRKYDPVFEELRKFDAELSLDSDTSVMMYGGSTQKEMTWQECLKKYSKLSIKIVNFARKNSDEFIMFFNTSLMPEDSLKTLGNECDFSKFWNSYAKFSKIEKQVVFELLKDVEEGKIKGISPKNTLNFLKFFLHETLSITCKQYEEAMDTIEEEEVLGDMDKHDLIQTTCKEIRIKGLKRKDIYTLFVLDNLILYTPAENLDKKDVKEITEQCKINITEILNLKKLAKNKYLAYINKLADISAKLTGGLETAVHGLYNREMILRIKLINPGFYEKHMRNRKNMENLMEEFTDQEKKTSYKALENTKNRKGHLVFLFSMLLQGMNQVLEDEEHEERAVDPEKFVQQYFFYF